MNIFELIQRLDEILWELERNMAEEICTACGGLGATVERYTIVDKDGYTVNAWRDKPCDACGGKGRITK